MRGKQLALSLLSGVLVLSGSLVVNAKSTSYKLPKVELSKTVVANIAFKPQSSSGLTDYVYDTVDPTSTNFHQYLTPDQFAEKFGRTPEQISAFQTYLSQYHLKSSAYPGNLALKVWGTRQNLIKAFNAKRVKVGKKDYRTKIKLPGKLASQTVSVIGVYATKPKANKAKTSVTPTIPKDSTPPNTDLSKTTFAKKYGAMKFADRYQLSNLYSKGLTGQGQRIGVITMNDFKTSDVVKYWDQNGVNADSSRVNKIYPVENAKAGKLLLSLGISAPQMESTLDVDQSGAVAPGANIDAYIGISLGNVTSSTSIFYIAFMNAVSDDRDKQLTTSFAPNVELASRWEQNASASMQQYSDAFNLMLEQAAAEGITVFRASGDYGPRELPSKQFNHVFSTSPYQVITGGTTLPYTRIIDGKIVTVNKERAWGDAYSDPKTKPSTYAGSGGGFSILNPTPRYQQGISGVNTFRAIDLLKYKDGGYLVQKDPQIIFGTGSGRNFPDVSANADNHTGYALYVSGDNLSYNSKTKKISSHYLKLWSVNGGTSFVSPQMAGANAVMNSGRDTPLGFWNPQIYKFATESDSPFNVLDDADNNNNLYYTGQPGKLYNQATGLGTINFDKLFSKFQSEK
ncbi:S53 family peptidase [Lentilactobacillus parabuchneri]|uniref:S53 family peptidase n=1 Tax=Lentilactobacillus parabuchneri TaxID=152331 RepID=UPI00178CAAEE|nr:S53 family peptidase [Lentilactobacillus parabuchneri]QOJ84757.1 S8/S53 family peptidase [Lentilactobacillus parabuchneri]